MLLMNLNIDTSIDGTVGVAQKAIKMLENGHSAEAVAGTVLHTITGSVKNKYTYGFVDNIKSEQHDMHSMVNWIFNDWWHTKPSGITLLQSADEYAGVHRSGWHYVVSMMQSLVSRNGILCDAYVDGTFLWNKATYLTQGVIPFRKPWIGFIHHTPSGGDNNLNKLFKEDAFQLSLRQCKGLITLSNYTKTWIQNNAHGIKVFTLTHPTEIPSVHFDILNFASNPRVVQIGAWLRDSYAIYRLRMQWAKNVLIGPGMTNYKHPTRLQLRDGSKCIPGICNVHMKNCHVYPSDICKCGKDAGEYNDCGICRPNICRQNYGNLNVCIQHLLHWLWNVAKHFGYIPEIITIIEDDIGCKCGQSDPDSLSVLNDVLNSNYMSVKEIGALNNMEYDILLSQAVVFLHLSDASAVNTIIECVMRNTPIIINKLPAVVEYLGDGYPLYYDNFTQIEKFTLADISKANTYMMNMDKQAFYIDTFIAGMRGILQQL